MKFIISIVASLLLIVSLNASTNKKGVYVGFGVGAGYPISSSDDVLALPGLIAPIEIGYGVADNILVYLQGMRSIGVNSETFQAIGVSYYLKNSGYFNAKAGIANSKILDDVEDRSGLGISAGYGLTMSKRTSLELDYTIFFLTTLNKNGATSDISKSLSSINAVFKYRLF